MTPIVVFDTNILFSATSWRGAPYQCLELARMGLVQHVTCQAILGELSEKLETKLAFSDAQITAMILDLLEFTDIIKITQTLKVVSDDPDDDMVIECAVSSRADYIVSGDRHLLRIENYQGIAIVNARTFLEKFAR